MLDRYTPSLAALCVAYAHYIRIESLVRDEPISVETAESGDKSNPAWAEFDRAYKRLMDALSRHGLTPSAASGITGVAAKPEERPQGLSRLRLAN